MANAVDTSHSCMAECHELLMALKNTVQELLAMHPSNVWSTYGGFKRISTQMEAILSHRIKNVQMFTYSDGVYWPFVRGLKWLRPSMTSVIGHVSQASRSNGQGGKGQVWLRESLQDHSLASQLEILVNDPEHLHYHYHAGAFLRNAEYVKAMLICLQALERNKVAILADINPKLLLRQKQENQSRCCICGGNTPNFRTSATECCISQGGNLGWKEFSKSLSSKDVFNLAEDRNFCSKTCSKEAIMCGDLGYSVAAYESLPSSPVTFSSSHQADFSASPNVHNPPNHDPLVSVIYGISPPLQHEITICDHVKDDRSRFNDRLQESLPGSGTNSSDFFHLDRQIYARHSTSSIPHIAVNAETNTASIDIANYADRGSNNHISENVQNGSVIIVEQNNSARDSVSKKKAHKRSQSDMGVSTMAANSVTFGNEKGFNSQSSENRFSDTAACSAPESTTHKVKRASLPGFHRSESVFQPPAKGQSLVSYLSEQDFNCCVTLERENAHFAIADMLISAFEQMKWETFLRQQSLMDNVTEESESDEEINELKQRIRMRRRERLVEKERKRFPDNSDGMNDTNTSSSPTASSQEFLYSSDLSDYSDDCDDQIELNLSGTESSNLELIHNSGLSLSMASLFSDADLQKSSTVTESHRPDKPNSEKSTFTAEAIALSLLSQFSEKRLPKASELEWLVSETDAPQALLPLPNSYPISPDDGENSDLMQTAYKTKLRGNLEWAPPRAQIIFTIHPPEKRSVILSRQNMRCAGCGTKVEPGFVKRLRYCEYMGKFFCQCCHSNSTAVIPGRIILRWDFSCHYVSNFARDLLQKIQHQPLFHLQAINPVLYRKVRMLEQIRILRRQLCHLYMLLNVCKCSSEWLKEVANFPKHWLENDDVYSIEDFLMVRSGQMLSTLRKMVQDAVNHVEECQLCQGLGFICELCQDKGIIFPFQINTTTLCPICQACYHKSCFVPASCPKCSRMEIRRKRLAQGSPEEVRDSGFVSESVPAEQVEQVNQTVNDISS